jgi:hypothetical protein
MANTQTTVPTFIPGQVLEASQLVNSAATGVPVFATTVTRDAGFGGAGEKALAEGQLCYLESTNVVQYYDGAAWATLAPTPAVSSGLTLIQSTVFTAASTLAMTNVFNSTYNDYLVLVTKLLQSTNAGSVRTNLGTSGTADTGANYDYIVSGNSSASGTVTDNATNQTRFDMLGSFIGSNDPSAMNIFLYNPNLASRTIMTAHNYGNQNAGQKVTVDGGSINTNTQYTDFFISTGTADTYTAVISVYGIAKS